MMTPGLTALGIASLLVWGGLWFYLWTLQKRLDAMEEDSEPQDEPRHPSSNPR